MRSKAPAREGVNAANCEGIEALACPRIASSKYFASQMAYRFNAVSACNPGVVDIAANAADLSRRGQGQQKVAGPGVIDFLTSLSCGKVFDQIRTYQCPRHWPVARAIYQRRAKRIMRLSPDNR